MNGAARALIATGAVLGFLAVALGAFGAHALKARLSPELLAVYQTGVQYHLPHAVAVVLIGVVSLHLPDARWLTTAGWCMAAGVVVFSGSLYLLALTGVRVLGAVTPIGGVLLLAGWATLAFSVITAKN